jgi:hypothetical protein
MTDFHEGLRQAMIGTVERGGAELRSVLEETKLGQAGEIAGSCFDAGQVAARILNETLSSKSRSMNGPVVPLRQSEVLGV